LSGTADGPVLYSQTAANLHAGVGDTINLASRPSGCQSHGERHRRHSERRFAVPAVGVPAGLAPQFPADNIRSCGNDVAFTFEGQRAAPAGQRARAASHFVLDRCSGADDPVDAFGAVKHMQTIWRRGLPAGRSIWHDIWRAARRRVRDALYAKVLFLFLGSPGWSLAALVANRDRPLPTKTAAGANRRCCVCAEAPNIILRRRGCRSTGHRMEHTGKCVC